MSDHDAGKKAIIDRFKFILPNNRNSAPLTSSSSSNRKSSFNNIPNEKHSSTQHSDEEDEGSKDQKSSEQAQCVAECERYFHECEEFLEMAKGQIDKATHRSNKFVIGIKFRDWMAKRTGNNLMHSYDSLAHHGEELEKRLLAFVENNLHSCNSLSFQAYTLQNRITSCVAYNQERTAELKPKMETLSVVLLQCSTYRNAILQMISFYDEIQQQKDNEYVPWAMRQVHDDYEKEHPHPHVQRGELEEEFEKVLRVTDVLEGLSKQHEPEYIAKTECVGVGLYVLSQLELHLRDTSVWLTKQHPKQLAFAQATAAYAACKASLQPDSVSSSGKVNQNNPILFKTFQNPIMMLKKTTGAEPVLPPPPPPQPSSSQPPSTSPPANPETVDVSHSIFPILPPYDHEHCGDCACAISMAEKCANHLSTRLTNVDELFDLLEKLQQVRQEVYKEEKALESIDWSHHSNQH